MADNAMPSHTVLMFAYHFPPETQIGAARPFRFYKYLSRLGYTCKVITAAAQPQPSPDVIYVPDPFIAAPQRFSWQIERAIRWSILPGAVGTVWSYLAYRAAREVFKREPAFQVTILSTFPPLGVHFAAWLLARTKGLPWIADFRDPLGARGLHGWLEKKIIRGADAVIANTDTSQQNWRRKHPDQAGKIHLLWNGFDPESRITAKPLPARGYKILAHTGELYAGRTAGPIIESIERLIEGGVIPRDAIRVRFVGTADASALGANDRLARAQAQGWIELSAVVPPAEAQEIIKTSDYLLLIQQQSATQVPGKLFDYLQMGRPILAFVMPDSPTEHILANSGVPYRCVYPQDNSQRMDRVIAEFLN
jgi:hypothetical protein